MSKFLEQRILDTLVKFRFTTSIKSEIDMYITEVNSVGLNQETQLPLSTALSLLHQHKGRLVIPDFMDISYLQQIFEQEKAKENEEKFCRISEHFFDLTRRFVVIFRKFPDLYDQTSVSNIDSYRDRILICRRNKLTLMMEKLYVDLDLTNVTQFELNFQYQSLKK